MKTSSWLLLSLATAASVAASAALAQNDAAGIAVITDPVKIAEIERHAQEIAARQQQAPESAADKPAHSHKKMHAKHHKMHAKHHKMHKAKPAEKAPKADAPAS